MNRFLAALAEHGSVPVPPADGIAAWEAGDCDEAIRATEAVARTDAPGEPPPLDLDVARWAARVLFRAAVCLADRAVGAEAVARLLREPPPPGAAASARGRWSADVFLRHLPALHGLAKGLSSADPLVREIERLGVEWPLSSVGMALSLALGSSAAAGAVESPAHADLSITATSPRALPAAVAAHPALRRLYVDRVLAAADTARLAEPWVAEAARAALGAHPRLAPEVAAALGMIRSADVVPVAAGAARPPNVAGGRPDRRS